MNEHNIQTPTYHSREFYGPLELAPENTAGSGRHIMIHPDNPSKLVRASGEGAYADKEEMDERVAGTQRVLNGLAEHGIVHVNPDYIDETSTTGEAYLVTVVDRLENIQSYNDLLSSETMGSDVVAAADATAAHMLDYATQAIHEGGDVDPEMMRLSQCAYNGDTLVLVDVEPIGAYEVDVEQDSMSGGFPSGATRTVAGLVVDVIELANKTDLPLTSLHSAIGAIEALPGDSDNTHTAKAALLDTINTRVISSEVANLAMGESLYNEDE